MELPELINLSRQMSKEIVGKSVSRVKVANPKCLNMSFERFQKIVVGKTIKAVQSKGKWLFIKLDSYLLLFNPGMGVDVVYFKADDKLPDKYQIKLTFSDRTGFTIRVWWFCYLHLVSESNLHQHQLTAKLGVDPFSKEFTLEKFRQILCGKRGGIKSFLLDQKNIAGIGNVYIQDILFNARLHPQRNLQSVTDEEIEALYRSIKSVLKESIDLGGLAYERDFYGNKGKYGPMQFKIAYKLGQPCPNCKTTIEKIRIGSTSSFVCLKCQPLDK